MEEAVRKMSAQPAQRLGLSDRGLLRPGLKADIAVFDPARVRDAATFEKPHQYADGFSVVIVNGQVVLENGAMTAARPGRVLYGPAHGGGKRLIDIGGRKLEMMRAGQGSPTVVFDAGLGYTLDTWSNILPRVAELTTAVSYSRAGMGASEPASSPRTLDAIVDDLRSLLEKAGLTGPYVLVGHSIGGLYMRYFATKYPAEVAGLVLVDGSHERQAIEFAKLTGAPPPPRPAPDPKQPASLEIAGFGPIMTAGSFGLAGKLPDVPMAVLTAARLGTSLQETPERRKVWRDLHAELFQQSSYGIHIVTAKSGHFIHRDEPDLVVDAIRFVVEAARKKR